MRIAIVHEWLTTMGGADRVVQIIHEIFPSAPMFCLVYNPKTMPDAFRAMDIRTSFIQRLPFARSHHRVYLPLYPLAAEQFDLSDFDVVISSSHCCAHNVLTRPDAFHLCYCHTPMRYAWDMYHSYLKSLPTVARPAAAVLLSIIRHWDYVSAQRVDKFVANSSAVRQRIEKHYGRPAAVLFPPADVSFFRPAPEHDQPGDYFFIMARHVSYKRVDLAVAAFNTLGLPLLVAGTGPETARLAKMARPNVRFLGTISNDDARRYMAHCRAFIHPQEEDFGITAVEAQACGRPVIAYGRGGALDTVIDGVTGSFFSEQTAEALAEAVRTFDHRQFDPRVIRQHAASFNTDDFKRKFRQLVMHDRPPRELALRTGDRQVVSC